ncbi:MAG: c-type cytochrome, partial [Mariprofundaceae bacterium]
MHAVFLFGALFAALPAFAADADRGKVVAEVRCTPCHHLHLTSKRIGPGLKGIFNRAPTITGVPFKRWDAEALDVWLAAPRAVKPNTGMTIPPVARRDREDLIAYFRRD